MIRTVRRTTVRLRIVFLLIFALLRAERPAYAQLDPLLPLKVQTPNIMLVVDTTSRMQRDADEIYYDPNLYTKAGAAWESTIGVTSTTAASKYYRKFVGLAPPLSLLGIPLDGLLYRAQRIETVGDRQPGFATFLERTRIEVARRGVLAAIEGNMSAARFNLLRLGQVVGASSFETTKLVYVTDGSQQPPSAVEVPPVTLLGIPLTAPGWKITRNTNVASGASAVSLLGSLIPSDAIGGNTLIRDQIDTATGTTGALVPLGLGDLTLLLSPVATLLQGTLTELVRWLTGAPVCQNSAIVMVVGGGEPLSLTSILLLVQQLVAGILGHRVPVHVVAIAPPANEVSFLEDIAQWTGGRFTNVGKDTIEATVPGQPVPEVVEAINFAVQQAHLPPDSFNHASPADLRTMTVEHQSASPVSGTVNLDGATDANGVLLPDTDTLQRANVMVTAGYTLPGFTGHLHAFRAYKPAGGEGSESTYVADDTLLWDASLPAPESRNIFTVLPDGTMVPFDATNAATLAPYLGPVYATDLIDRIRTQPLGAIIGSTPAFMDPPSLDRSALGGLASANAYAFFKDLNRDRRTLIFVGATDGMMHAFDARTGLEVWAFIPFNILPKLRALPRGQGMDAGFAFTVEGSPKLADVYVGDEWRTYMFFGQGPGGTFYNALDVTLHRMDQVVSPTADSAEALLAYFSTPGRMPFVWSFPRLVSFDASVDTAATPYGDLRATASDVEKSVGQTWSTPAVAPIGASNQYSLLVGSGYLPYSVQQTAARDGAVAGTTFYALDAATGTVLGTADVGSDGSGEHDDRCWAPDVANCMRSKNALQMDPTVVGDGGGADAAYVGDLDGRVWRMALSLDADGDVSVGTPARLYDAGAADPLYASLAVTSAPAGRYLFVATGSELLPSAGVSHEYRVLSLLDTGGTSASTLGERRLAATDGSGDDEKVTTFPVIAGHVAFFTTTVYKPGTPCTPFDARVYALAVTGGAAFDANGSGTITDADAVIHTAQNVRATAPFAIDGRLAVGIGDTVQLFGDTSQVNRSMTTNGIRLLSWREVR